jgi:hypothetical protein
MFLRNQQPNPITTNEGTMTAYYATLTVDNYVSGTIAAKQQISDGGTVSADACVIWAHLAGGTGTGSTWLVICANPQLSVASEQMETTPSQVEIKGTNDSSNRQYLEMSVNNYSPYCAPDCSGSSASEVGYMTDVSPGTVASQLQLVSDGSAIGDSFADTPGDIVGVGGTFTTVAGFMDSLSTRFPSLSFDHYCVNYTVDAPSSTNYLGGPEMPYGALADLESWSDTFDKGCF